MGFIKSEIVRITYQSVFKLINAPHIRIDIVLVLFPSAARRIRSVFTYSGGYSATDSGDTRPPLLELQRYQYFFLILSPFSSKRRDLCAILSRQASASISLLKTPYQSDTASWLDRINDFL